MSVYYPSCCVDRTRHGCRGCRLEGDSEVDDARAHSPLFSWSGKAEEGFPSVDTLEPLVLTMMSSLASLMFADLQRPGAEMRA